MVIPCWMNSTDWQDKPVCRTEVAIIMIEVNNNIAKVEGTAKEVCIEFTHLVVHLIKTLEREFNLSQAESIDVLNECCKIAYMDDDGRAEYLNNILKEE